MFILAIGLFDILLSMILSGIMISLWLSNKERYISDIMFVERQKKFISNAYDKIRELEWLIISITCIAVFLKYDSIKIFLCFSFAVVFLIASRFKAYLTVQPINKQIMSWSINYIPGKWQYLRGKLLSAHLFRTMLTIFAFILILIANILEV